MVTLTNASESDAQTAQRAFGNVYVCYGKFIVGGQSH